MNAASASELGRAVRSSSRCRCGPGPSACPSRRVDGADPQPDAGLDQPGDVAQRVAEVAGGVGGAVGGRVVGVLQRRRRAERVEGRAEPASPRASRRPARGAARSAVAQRARSSASSAPGELERVDRAASASSGVGPMNERGCGVDADPGGGERAAGAAGPTIRSSQPVRSAGAGRGPLHLLHAAKCERVGLGWPTACTAPNLPAVRTAAAARAPGAGRTGASSWQRRATAGCRCWAAPRVRRVGDRCDRREPVEAAAEARARRGCHRCSRRPAKARLVVASARGRGRAGCRERRRAPDAPEHAAAARPRRGSP